MNKWQSFAEAAQAAGISVELSRPIARHTTYGVGGEAACFISVSSESELLQVAQFISTQPSIDVAVVGRGSNLLIADNGFDGVVVLMAYVASSHAIEVVDAEVIASGAMPMPILARRTATLGLSGLEWCVGIPGSVGGAVRMNAGGHGAEIVDSLVSAKVVSMKSGNISIVSAHDLGFHFRGSAIASHHVVVSTRFSTVAADSKESLAKLDEIVSWRRQHQPGGRNAGSVFVNPAPGEHSAGSLIDSCGLRECEIGAARVSEKHANFIQASDGATAADVIALMTHVQKIVEVEKGIRLRSEVCLLGFDEETTQRFMDPRHNDIERIANAARLCEILGESQ